MNTNELGRLTQAKVVAALLAAGKNVLVPYANVGRYDLALDDDGRLVRIECKTGRCKDGVITFASCSSGGYGTTTNIRDYRQDADYFGVWCPEVDKVYLVAVSICGLRYTSLRVEPQKRRGGPAPNWAAEFEVSGPIV
jgi:hypothetical protein